MTNTLSIASYRRRPWQNLSLQEKQLRLKEELQEEMLAMAQKMGLNLSLHRITRAIEHTRYSPDEIEVRHFEHESWAESHQSLS